MRLAYALFAFAFVAARPAEADTIRDIVIEGNTRTTSATVELVSRIDVGDDWTDDKIEQIKTELVTSGLFRDVEVFSEPCSPASTPRCSDSGVRVHLRVHDKSSWVVAPVVYTQPTNTGGGVGFGENNLFGLNQKLLLDAQVATGDSSLTGAWVNPSLWGSQFHSQLDIWLKSSRVIEYQPAHTFFDSHPVSIRESRINDLDAGYKLGVDVFHGLELDARLRGAYVNYSSARARTLDDGAFPAMPDGQPVDIHHVPKPGKEGWDVSTEISLTFDRRADWFGVQTGYRYQASVEYSVPELGSDFHYHLYSLSLWEGWQVFEHHNLSARGAVNYGHHLPFQQEFTLGGTSMRGYLNDQYRGDLRITAGLEYSLPLFTLFGLSVRGLGFVDSGYITFRSSEDNPERNYLFGAAHDKNSVKAPLKNSVGVGTRLCLRQIVIPLLGVDFGYGLEARDFQLYLAIGLTY